MFPGLFTIITPYPDIIITGHRVFKVLQLLILAFLSSENIKTVKLNQLGDIRIPLPPAITIRRVTRIRVTQIISGNYHRLRLQRKHGAKEK